MTNLNRKARVAAKKKQKRAEKFAMGISLSEQFRAFFGEDAGKTASSLMNYAMKEVWPKLPDDQRRYNGCMVSIGSDGSSVNVIVEWDMDAKQAAIAFASEVDMEAAGVSWSDAVPALEGATLGDYVPPRLPPDLRQATVTVPYNRDTDVCMARRREIAEDPIEAARIAAKFGKLADKLRDARPTKGSRCRSEVNGGGTVLRDIEMGCDVPAEIWIKPIDREGFDPEGRLGPTYWRVTEDGYYLSTFMHPQLNVPWLLINKLPD